jgi:hypothetical protein
MQWLRGITPKVLVELPGVSRVTRNVWPAMFLLATCMAWLVKSVGSKKVASQRVDSVAVQTGPCEGSRIVPERIQRACQTVCQALIDILWSHDGLHSQ